MDEENHLSLVTKSGQYGTVNLLTLAQILVPEFGRKKMGQLVEIREDEGAALTLERHRFRAWTERLAAESSTTLFLSLLNQKGQQSSRRTYSSTGHDSRRAAIDAAGQHLERALLTCSRDDYRTYRVTKALRLAVESGDDQAALSAAWKCIAELPEPVERRCWIFNDEGGEDVLVRMRDLSSHISDLVGGAAEAQEGWASVAELLSIQAIEDEVRRAAESHPDFVPWTDVLVESVRPGFEACARVALVQGLAIPELRI